MWTSERSRGRPVGEAPAELGRVTLGGDPAGVTMGGERRWLPVYGPGGYCWRPTVDDKVLVLKTGNQGESPCILGKQQQLDELQPGEVRLTGGESGIFLGQDKLELTGAVQINGRTLESIITEIVLELIG